MLYLILDGTKHYLDNAEVEKYGLKAGICIPFTGYEVFEDKKSETETAAANSDSDDSAKK